jgi:hypothetical protein
MRTRFLKPKSKSSIKREEQKAQKKAERYEARRKARLKRRPDPGPDDDRARNLERLSPLRTRNADQAWGYWDRVNLVWHWGLRVR